MRVFNFTLLDFFIYLYYKTTKKMERSKTQYEKYMDSELVRDHMDDDYNYSLWLKGKMHQFNKQNGKQK